jgi:Mg/Co/Ni transporter MgtE
LGTIFSKYAEVSIKSNEQLIKIINILKKDQPGEFDGFDDDEKEAILDQIQEEANAAMEEKSEEE